MKERLLKLEELIEKFKEESYADQYHIADFIEDGKSVTMDKLCEEVELYNKTIKDINKILIK